ncbi:MAG: hypothetical protein HYW47_01740 [Deltaproteobacteria bacterium]|nr:hypothetical protein [Deltaproteobacteria bacterium]
MEQLTLKEIQIKLGMPQHVLIHLCEKNVIVPEFEQTQGRGQWRKFSQKNLFEFIVALELRKYEISVSTTAIIMKVISSFEKAVQKKLKNFNLPHTLVEKKIPLNFYIFNGNDLLFEIKKSVMGFDLQKVIRGNIKNIHLKNMSALPKKYESLLKLDLVALAEKAL